MLVRQLSLPRMANAMSWPSTRLKEEFPKYPQEELGENYPDHVKPVIQALHMSHLSPKEKEYVFHWAEDYADIFHLNSEKLTSTHLSQHRIPTIDDKVITRKQYRTPHKANDQIHNQIEKQYTSGIIGNSKSPYNSPLLIELQEVRRFGRKKVEDCYGLQSP